MQWLQLGPTSKTVHSVVRLVRLGGRKRREKCIFSLLYSLVLQVRLDESSADLKATRAQLVPTQQNMVASSHHKSPDVKLVHYGILGPRSQARPAFHRLQYRKAVRVWKSLGMRQTDNSI